MRGRSAAAAALHPPDTFVAGVRGVGFGVTVGDVLLAFWSSLTVSLLGRPSPPRRPPSASGRHDLLHMTDLKGVSSMSPTATWGSARRPTCRQLINEHGPVQGFA